ncbi:MAG: histidine--tRNA ligase [Clostridiales bacterium]|nr:histidine--tRNA ligase [Clostridiales bacterium]
MELLTRAIKGTQDLLPSQSHENQYIESSLLEIAGNFGFREIRTPVFEHTELFTRCVGDTTDVVQKEMYTFEDKGGRSITLRPEGTAGAVRAFLEHGLFNEPLPQKLCYLTSCYRYEKPQAGRLREFHQFGVECLGTASPAADAEIISLGDHIFDFLGVENLSLEINSIGCLDCRKDYHRALKEYFKAKKGELCPTCIERLERNPMRILDCKSPVCSKIAADAPVVLDYICEPCKEHFEQVEGYLDAMNITYKVNPRIVRGLDYYTRTVFEFVSNEIGAQGTVLGGGRYDGLVAELGGQSTTSLGFAMGLERLLLLMHAQGIPFPSQKGCDVYIIPVGENAYKKAAAMAFELRSSGLSAQLDVAGRSVKAQMKFADKIGAAYTVVLGEDELNGGTLKLKYMKTGEITQTPLESFAEDFMEISIRRSTVELEEMLNGSEIDDKKF